VLSLLTSEERKTCRDGSLDRYVGGVGGELVSDCRKCCTEDSDDSISKVTYSGAILEVCMRKLVFYPEIVGFIEEEKDRFPSVKVQYIFNSPPKLILLDDADEHKETIRIDNWKREHILQFLQGKYT
ncbi:selenoprotein family protein, partial [Prunus dulcis]